MANTASLEQPSVGAQQQRPARSTGFYAPELDGLRCLAVATVIIAHFSPTLNQRGDWGNIGVRLFFVLSGFLITTILFRTRDRCDSGETTVSGALKTFFIRRAFRLWPIYFLTLGVAYTLHVPGTEMSIWWHALFATNQFVFHTQSWPTLLSHYWTLAVEQQFYIFWPVVVLLIPVRVQATMLFSLALCGPISRAVLLIAGTTAPPFVGVLLPSCLDFFAFGGLVAWTLSRSTRTPLDQWLGSWIVPAFLATWITLGMVFKTFGIVVPYWPVFDGTIEAIGFAGLLLFVLRNPTVFWCRLLRNRVSVYLGQISYGIYIYHNFMHRLGPSVLRRLTGHNYFETEWAHVCFLTGLTILVSAASYHGLELPLRKLGRRWT